MLDTAFHIETKRLLLRKMDPELHKYVFTHLNETEQKEFFGHESDEAMTKEIQMFKEGLTSYNRSFCIFATEFYAGAKKRRIYPTTTG
jgi:hypothetical protein